MFKGCGEIQVDRWRKVHGPHVILCTACQQPQLEDEVRHLRRRLARCEEDLTQLRRRINQLERHRPGHKDGTYRE
ncbi:hypothetical protein EB796_008512 [Bugula neritina]|uniref:Uncharacterized protein n=1 Tax=Bugula neritina TaxID=10212 RepID=A0A7J7K5M4_BUGNE|nr:hypothetical protein EB796_008512 [Bugula neritina]